MVPGKITPYGYGISSEKSGSGKKASAPTLEKKHHTYFLRFSYTEEVSLSKTAVKEQVICSVDLGINTDAVCSIMRTDGTILERKFINFTSDKDICIMYLAESAVFRENISPDRSKADGIMQKG